MGYEKRLSRHKILMSRIIFPWMTNALEKYASLHIEKEKIREVLAHARHRVQNYPFKYYLICIFSFFVMEYILPLWIGKLSRFSKLNKHDAYTLLTKLQNTRSYGCRLFLILCKAPILLEYPHEI